MLELITNCENDLSVMHAFVLGDRKGHKSWVIRHVAERRKTKEFSISVAYGEKQKVFYLKIFLFCMQFIFLYFQ